MAIFALLLAFSASLIGGICGIGGGVIIKPILDAVGYASVPTISFLSSCTVLSMSLYNVTAGAVKKSAAIERGKGDALAISAALGGIGGNLLFQSVKSASGGSGLVGAAQSLFLMLLVLGTLIYTRKKDQITPLRLESLGGCAIIGFALGTVSSFLGIGGGPFNLVVLHYFLGYDTKRAVENSLYIILLSQAANILLSVVMDTVPDFRWASLALMVLGGISGGAAGRKISKGLDGCSVDRLFRALLCVIIVICVFNTVRYL